MIVEFNPCKNEKLKSEIVIIDLESEESELIPEAIDIPHVTVTPNTLPLVSKPVNVCNNNHRSVRRKAFTPMKYVNPITKPHRCVDTTGYNHYTDLFNTFSEDNEDMANGAMISNYDTGNGTNDIAYINKVGNDMDALPTVDENDSSQEFIHPSQEIQR